MVLLLPALLAAVPLFDGRTLNGWMHEGPRMSFSAANGELAVSGLGDPPNWLHSVAEYEDFRLRFEYKLNQWAEAAVIMRAPRAGRPQQAGLALMLSHDFHHEITPWTTGAIQGALAAETKKAFEWEPWHAVEVELRGEHFRAAIDGMVVQDVDMEKDPELRLRLKRGFIGFPDMGYGYRLRRIEIEDLGLPSKFVTLFDGRSLGAWALRDAGNWMVRDEAIYASNGHGIYYAPGVFKDFELTLLVRSHNHVNAGVFLRGEAAGKRRGFEVQIYSPVDAVYPTGSVYNKKRSNVTSEYEERWFLVQIRVEGSRCLVRLDGVTVAEYDTLAGEDLSPGRIGLQIHRDNAAVEYRDIRVRPL